MEWTSSKIRQTYLDFFQKKQHQVVPSAPMVVKDDPSLMFTNAGMNQFKEVFLDISQPKSNRVTDSQKCLRVSGKHNDLEEVGVDTYHHTMFEMLGNWSFGDYFKKETIEWAWELLTEVYGIDPDRIYVTVFGGDETDKLGRDDDAATNWAKWIDADRILDFGRKDNFWEMGETGPCGPCSEIHVDLRSDSERELVDGKTLVNLDHPHVVEVWNLVFIQYNRTHSKQLEALPKQHVDTGMGFERLAMVLQGKISNYDTDVFTPLISSIAKAAGISYGGTQEKRDVAVRVIADHIRAISFSIADGQLPSNAKAGYVIRRILRRAVRYAYSFLDLKEPFLYAQVQVLVDQMGEAFPELTAQKSLIERVIREEEESFLRTLDKGIQRINEIVNNTSYKVVGGKKLFELYDTFGFPLDLTALILREHNREVDHEGFEKELAKQKERSRQAAKVETGDWVEVHQAQESRFVGYDQLEEQSRILRYRKVNAKGKDRYQLVLDKTPFYAEAGGQVGDKGWLEAGENRISIFDTQKENNLTVHFTEKLPSDPSVTWTAKVDQEVRLRTEYNHSATHLLHKALREVLGTHVEQKGSLVNAEYLRFDFSHFAKVTDEELQKVEELVNERIRADHPLDEQRSVPFDQAKEMGAMALFGEKYGDEVRVIRFGDSVELCGGTHVASTGRIGFFKLVSESSVASGIRRIEAYTAGKAESYVRDQMEQLQSLRQLLRNPADITKSVNDLLGQNNQLQKELDKLKREKAGSLKTDLLDLAENIDGTTFIAQQVELDAKGMKDLAFQIREASESVFLVLGAAQGEKAMLTVMLSEDLVKNKSLHAGNIVKELAKEIQGGGGGQPFLATAGGANAAGIPAALLKAKELILA